MKFLSDVRVRNNISAATISVDNELTAGQIYENGNRVYSPLNKPPVVLNTINMNGGIDTTGSISYYSTLQWIGTQEKSYGGYSVEAVLEAICSKLSSSNSVVWFPFWAEKYNDDSMTSEVAFTGYAGFRVYTSNWGDVYLFGYGHAGESVANITLSEYNSLIKPLGKVGNYSTYSLW